MYLWGSSSLRLRCGRAGNLVLKHVFGFGFDGAVLDIVMQERMFQIFFDALHFLHTCAVFYTYMRGERILRGAHCPYMQVMDAHDTLSFLGNCLYFIHIDICGYAIEGKAHTVSGSDQVLINITITMIKLKAGSSQYQLV